MTTIITNPQERTRFLRFAVVGIIGAVVDFGVMNLLTRVFNFPLVLAGTISFIAAIISNFTWNRYWTYPDSRTKPIGHQLFQFTVVSLIGLAIRTPLIAYLEPFLTSLFGKLSVLPIGFVTAELLGENIALAIAVVVVMFWNFFINRYWTYSDVE
jgi:putative flippase GtrA